MTAAPVAPVTTTQALVWRGGDRLAVETLPVPTLGPGEALVRVSLATVCGSDRHTVSGRRAAPCPSVLGHEGVGEIVALGPDAPVAVDGAALHESTRVVWSVTLGCGDCDRCRSGLTAKCRTLRKAGHESLDSRWPLSGSYAQHVVLPAGLAIAAVPDELADQLAAPAACATATVMAALERAGSLAARRVIIVGAGMLGLTACAAAHEAGAVEIHAVDPDSERRAMAFRFGAGTGSGAADDAPPADVVLDFSGVPTAIESALAHLDVGGTAVLAGSVTPAPPLAIDGETVVRRYLTVTGVHNYEPRHLVRAVEFLTRTRITLPWQELVAPAVSLADLPRLMLGPAGPTPRYAVAP